eukprot:gene40083-49568_t
MAQPYVGEIRMFAGNFAPVGWMFCEGQQLAISENETLYQLIGTTYGGDGQSTFHLPDMRGRVPMHQGTGPGLSGHGLGEALGVETVTLTVSQIPQHRHAPVATPALPASIGATPFEEEAGGSKHGGKKGSGGGGGGKKGKRQSSDPRLRHRHLAASTSTGKQIEIMTPEDISVAQTAKEPAVLKKTQPTLRTAIKTRASVDKDSKPLEMLLIPTTAVPVESNVKGGSGSESGGAVTYFNSAVDFLSALKTTVRSTANSALQKAADAFADNKEEEGSEEGS